jgi:hypothetical protein
VKRVKSTVVLAIAVLAVTLVFPGVRAFAAGAADSSAAAPEKPVTLTPEPAATPAPPAPARAKAKPPAGPVDELTTSWQPTREWMSFRVGMAKSLAEDAADGSVAGGIGFSRMISGLHLWRFTPLRRWSLGGYVEVNQIGRFGDASEIEVPLTAELVRHYQWGTPYLRPYLGLGGGAFFRKLYRTGADVARVKGGGYLVLGANAPINSHRVLGVDVRFARVDGENGGVNPVFGAGKSPVTHWSMKLNYAITY